MTRLLEAGLTTRAQDYFNYHNALETLAETSPEVV